MEHEQGGRKDVGSFQIQDFQWRVQIIACCTDINLGNTRSREIQLLQRRLVQRLEEWGPELVWLLDIAQVDFLQPR